MRPRKTWLRRFDGFADAGTALLVTATVLALAARHHWVSDLCANLRIQWIVGLLGLAACNGLRRRWSLFALQTAALCVNLFSVIPAIVETATADGSINTETASIRVCTANVLTSNRDYATITMFPFGLILDHVLATPDLKCHTCSVSPDMGSDHRCVTATFAGP